MERVRAETPHRVIYVDAGDVEDKTVRLSNLTNGVGEDGFVAVAVDPGMKMAAEDS